MLRRALGSATLAGAGFVGGCYYLQYRRLELPVAERATRPPPAAAARGPPPLRGADRPLSERVLEQAVMNFLGIYSKLCMQVCNTTVLVDADPLTTMITGGPAARGGRGLVTISNHVTAVDDPGVLATLAGWLDFYTKPDLLRWEMCATDRCFRSRAMLPFYRGGRVLPIERGGAQPAPPPARRHPRRHPRAAIRAAIRALPRRCWRTRPSRDTGGLYHAFMEDIVSKLGFGDWVHVFPTGTRDKVPHLATFWQ